MNESKLDKSIYKSLEEDPEWHAGTLRTARQIANKYRSIEALAGCPIGEIQQGMGLLSVLVDEIDKLNAENDKLKAAYLEVYSLARSENYLRGGYNISIDECRKIAKDALEMLLEGKA